MDIEAAREAGDRAAFEQAAEILAARGFKQLANELRHGCLALKRDEPFFVLRGQDVTAPSCVDHWCNLNNASAPEAKIEAARDVAFSMQRYAGPRKNPD
jgi:hypothetical protein